MSTYLLITPNSDELYHHGILGMKWGVRRFQPYQPGARVKGGKEVGKAAKVKQREGIVERFKARKAAKKKAESIKKAQQTRKANADFEAEKKKAIESGSIEDLAKFKGKLTNEEYGRAFVRIQNEQKLNAMVAANQKSVWDTIDKGAEIVNRVSGYMGVVANAKNKYDAMNDALHKKENDEKKERATIEKNKFLTNIDNITELNEGVEKHKITPQEYQAAMNILANKKRNRVMFGKKVSENVFEEDQDFEDQNKKAAKEKAARDQADRDRWTAEQSWKQYKKAQEKERKKQAKEAWKKYNEPKDGEWRKDDPQEKDDKKKRFTLSHSALNMPVDELYHHGIKGQKWGVRRFQDKKGRLTAAGKERVAKYRLLNRKDTVTEGHSYREKSSFSYKVDLDTFEAEERVMPDGRIIYPAIATVIKDFANDGMGNPYPGPKGFDGLYDRVNPGYGEPGTTNNCPFVGATMEIASRGYNVVARRSLGGTSVGAFSLWFKGADTQKCDTWDEMSSDLKNMDDGASGVMQGYYGSGLGSGCGGHTLHWRKENGKVIVADGQSHKEMDFDKVQDSYGFGSKGCFFTRLDNCEPNWDALAADGVLGVNNSARKIVSKNSADTVLPHRAWSSTEFYGYSDVQAYGR